MIQRTVSRCFHAVRAACQGLPHVPKVHDKGHRLIAIDGTKVGLPPDKKVGESFGYHFCSTQKPAPVRSSLFASP